MTKPNLSVGREIRLRDFLQPERSHTISIADRTCDCGAVRRYGGCEHLDAVGIRKPRPFTPTTHPTFSQALSGLVKSLRIRRLSDAIYWLVYLDSFPQPQHRYRTARRILIGSAEDGNSIKVMERVADQFSVLSKMETPLFRLVTEAVRVCQLPNWWDTRSGGQSYIYSSLVGERQWRYRRWDRRLPTLLGLLETATVKGDVTTALGAATAFGMVPEHFGSTKQAEFLIGLAERLRHREAARLCRVHLAAKSALSGDSNFLCQAVWLMAGGECPIVDDDPQVSLERCDTLLREARARWEKPEPIPRWCLDGVHSAGDDPRFMGMLPEMWAVCLAFNHYGRVDPQDEWLPTFRCFDGLEVEVGEHAAAR